MRSPPAPRGGARRNLAFTVEISTPPPPRTLPAPPSYVHRPAYSHELLLWAMSYRGQPTLDPSGVARAGGAEPAAAAAARTEAKVRHMDEVVIEQAGSCTAAKAAATPFVAA